MHDVYTCFMDNFAQKQALEQNYHFCLYFPFVLIFLFCSTQEKDKAQ